MLSSGCGLDTKKNLYYFCDAQDDFIYKCTGLDRAFGTSDDCPCTVGSCQPDGSCAIATIAFDVLVRDLTSSPIEDASVQITGQSMSVRYKTGVDGKITNDQGEKRSDAFPARQDYVVQVSKYGYNPKTITYSAPIADIAAVFNLEPADKADVKVKVSSAVDDAPIPEAGVALDTYADESAARRSGTTSSVGVLLFSNIFLGNHAINASKIGYKQAWKFLTLIPTDKDTTVTVDLSLMPGSCFWDIKQPIDLKNPVPVPLQPKMLLNWTQNICRSEQYVIYRCNASSPPPLALTTLSPTAAERGDCLASGFTPIQEMGSTAPVVDTFIDTDIAPDTVYCYKIAAYYDIPLLGQKFFGPESTIKCAGSMRAPCLAGYNQTCTAPATGPNLAPGFNTLVETCTLNNTFSTPTPCASTPVQSVCIQNGTNAYCAQISDCEKCNGLFDMFAYHGTSLWTSPSTGLEYEFGCADAHIQTCYKDYSLTTQDVYRSCAGITACYNYTSQSSCENDASTCAAGGKSGCEWERSKSYGELGVGVCRPKDTALQDCTPCNARAPHSAFDECTHDLCQLYSAGNCYFNRKD